MKTRVWKMGEAGGRRVRSISAGGDLTLLSPGAPFLFVKRTISGEGDPSELPVDAVGGSAFYMDKCDVTKTLWDAVYQWAANHGCSLEYGADGKATNHPARRVKPTARTFSSPLRQRRATNSSGCTNHANKRRSEL